MKTDLYYGISHVSPEEARQAFVKRFQCEPVEVFLESGFYWVGPVLTHLTPGPSPFSIKPKMERGAGGVQGHLFGFEEV